MCNKDKELIREAYTSKEHMKQYWISRMKPLDKPVTIWKSTNPVADSNYIENKQVNLSTSKDR